MAITTTPIVATPPDGDGIRNTTLTTTAKNKLASGKSILIKDKDDQLVRFSLSGAGLLEYTIEELRSLVTSPENLVIRGLYKITSSVTVWNDNPEFPTVYVQAIDDKILGSTGYTIDINDTVYAINSINLSTATFSFTTDSDGNVPTPMDTSIFVKTTNVDQTIDGEKVFLNRLTVQDTVEADAFVGDGSGLTNLPIPVYTAGDNIDITNRVITATGIVNKVDKYVVDGVAYPTAYDAVSNLANNFVLTLRGDIAEQIEYPILTNSYIDATSAVFGLASALSFGSNLSTQPYTISISGGTYASSLGFASTKSSQKNRLIIQDGFLTGSAQLIINTESVPANGLIDEVELIRFRGTKTSAVGTGINMFRFLGNTFSNDRPIKLILTDCELESTVGSLFGGFTPRGTRIYLRGSTKLKSIASNLVSGLGSKDVDANTGSTPYTEADIIVDERSSSTVTIEQNLSSNSTTSVPSVKAVRDAINAIPSGGTIDESNLVHKTGDETIAGKKKFTELTKFVTSGGNSAGTGMAALFTSPEDGSTNAGNFYTFAINKAGVDAFFLGINKNSPTGQVPSNSVFFSSYSSVGTISFGRGDNNGNPSTSDLFISSQGYSGFGTSSPSEKVDVIGNIKSSNQLIAIELLLASGKLFVENGALKYRGGNGTITTVAPA